VQLELKNGTGCSAVDLCVTHIVTRQAGEERRPIRKLTDPDDRHSYGINLRGVGQMTFVIYF
jgi:hypothetical protein